MRLLGTVLLLVVLSGCLNAPRRPYTEVPILPTSSASEDTINLWPLYNGNGKVNYFAWPFIKYAPGCFAIQPLYNYDNGIHDLGLVLTASPHTGEYRLWPIFYYSPRNFYLFPFVKYRRGFFSPLVWYHSEKNSPNYTLFSPLYTQMRTDSRFVNWLFPLYYFKSADDNLVFRTPLGGWCKNEPDRRTNSGDYSYWYFLNVGAWEQPKGLYGDHFCNWAFPLWFNWGDSREETQLFIPFYHRYTYNSAKTNWVNQKNLKTPFFGWGAYENGSQRYWYAFNMGYKYYRIQNIVTTHKWFLPFWFCREEDAWSRLTWTPLAKINERRSAIFYKDDSKIKGFDVGPFGYGLLMSYNRCYDADSLRIFPFIDKKTTYYTWDKKWQSFPHLSYLGYVREDVKSVLRQGFWGYLYNFELLNPIDTNKNYKVLHPLASNRKYPSELDYEDEVGGHKFSLLKGLVRHDNHWLRKGKKRFEKRNPHLRPLTQNKHQSLGWYLYDFKKTIIDERQETKLFTPLLSWASKGDTTNTVRKSCGGLVDAIRWQWSAAEKNRKENVNVSLFYKFLYDYHSSPAKGDTSYDYKNERRTLLKKFDPSYSFRVLKGFLYSYSKSGSREWYYPTGTNPPEYPLYDHYRKKHTFLTKYFFSSENERNGTQATSLLSGLLYEHKYNAPKKVRSLGILGYLYRFNQYEDGSREQIFFPFVRKLSNEKKGTSSFSFWHKFIRYESTPDGSDFWFAFIPLW